MDSSNNTSNSNYQEPLSSFLNLPQPPPTSSLFDPLPSYLPTFRSSNIPTTEPSSSSSSVQLQPSTRANSKKRSRASRRAPTTVLTTDTSNFRAMVQEFTGFPAPPFSASSFVSPFPPRPHRLHLASPSPSPSSSSPYYLSRPFAHKISTASSSLVDAIAANTSISLQNIISNYPFVNPSIIGIQSPIPSPQFGDLGRLVASEAMQQERGSTRAGGLSSWVDGSRDQDVSSIAQECQPEKRQKTVQTARTDVAESWTHPSD